MIFNFGKWKGQECTDMQYLIWVLLNVDRDDIDYEQLASEIEPLASRIFTKYEDKAFDLPLFPTVYCKLRELGHEPRLYMQTVIQHWEVCPRIKAKIDSRINLEVRIYERQKRNDL